MFTGDLTAVPLLKLFSKVSLEGDTCFVTNLGFLNLMGPTVFKYPLGRLTDVLSFEREMRGTFWFFDGEEG